MLGNKVNGKEIVYVNLGMSALNFGGVLANIKEVLKHKSEMQPSLVIIYSGHNEFYSYQEPWGGWKKGKHSLFEEIV